MNVCSIGRSLDRPKKPTSEIWVNGELDESYFDRQGRAIIPHAATYIKANECFDRAECCRMGSKLCVHSGECTGQRVDLGWGKRRLRWGGRLRLIGNGGSWKHSERPKQRCNLDRQQW